jgi:hypothetical protein
MRSEAYVCAVAQANAGPDLPLCDNVNGKDAGDKKTASP